jgi:general secretion pathway protein A
MSYRAFFGLSQKPFAADLPLEAILKTQDLLEVQQRILYTIDLGAIASGHRRGRRRQIDHPALGGRPTAPFQIQAPLGHRHLRLDPGSVPATAGRARYPDRLLLAGHPHRADPHPDLNLVQSKKQQPVLIIDEASLLRLDVFAELHTLTQFEADSKPYLPMILAGQNNLADNLLYRTAVPLASRIVARRHLQEVNREGMERYLEHHLKIAGLKHSPFDAQAITAIHQGSGGLFRKANHLARGALVAATSEKSQVVTAEHVRRASTELF